MFEYLVETQAFDRVTQWRVKSLEAFILGQYIPFTDPSGTTLHGKVTSIIVEGPSPGSTQYRKPPPDEVPEEW